MPTSGITTASWRRVDTLEDFIPAAMFARRINRGDFYHNLRTYPTSVIGAASLDTTARKTERHVGREV
ncbi:hypothetical protein KCP70_21520 [Salmonella enterica subsp. enterica]|nr:hypothetical protein KCP70_21520 [Salmonella enterica subsp. enterica]